MLTQTAAKSLYAHSRVHNSFPLIFNDLCCNCHPCAANEPAITILYIQMTNTS